MSIRTNFEFTSRSLRFHLDSTWISLRPHIDFPMVSLWVRFGWTSDSLRFRFDLIPILLRFHVHLNSSSCRDNFGFASVSLHRHFEITSTSSRFSHIRRGTSDALLTHKGKRQGSTFQRETGKSRHNFWDQIPLGNQPVRMHKRKTETERNDFPVGLVITPNLRFSQISSYGEITYRQYSPRSSWTKAINSSRKTMKSH